MISRIFIFIMFQLVAWWLYFDWNKETVDTTTMNQRVMQVHEVSNVSYANNSVSSGHYQLILRNDGVFTKMNNGRMKESGLWTINYDIPSIVLTSPVASYKYRILENEGNNLELELINAHEILEMKNKSLRDENKALFSSSVN